MTKINRSTGNLLTCIFELLVGILLLINPVGFTSGIIIVCIRATPLLSNTP